MTGPGCTATRDAIPELALGVLDGEARAEALQHVSTCAACQRHLDEMAAVTDGLNQLAAELEPPSGFARDLDGTIRGARRRAMRRWVATVAVTAAAAAILSVAIVRIVDVTHHSSHPTAAPALRSVAMVGSDGLPVGHVTVSASSPASVVVNVDYNVPDGTYTLRVREATGPPEPIGTITIADGRGQWTGTAPIQAGPGVSLELVSPEGTVVCQAMVNQPQAIS